MSSKRESFTGKIGFILSCVGAAIGLGNIWIFSWKLGKYGGAAFLIPYFIFMVLFAVVGLIGEISFGRMMKKGVLGVTEMIEDRRIPFKKYIPLLPILAVTGIFTFYVIVFGWIMRYFFSYASGSINSVDFGSYFGDFAGTSASIPWHLAAIVLCVGIISLGVVKGIERINKVIMPVMFIIFLGLMIKSLSLPGARAGIIYLLKPDWTLLKNPVTWVMALGQAFFTVGLSGSAMLVYGSYLKDDMDIFDSVVKTCLLDTIAALMAGFIIIPAAFAFGMDPGAGPALLFITVPAIFSQIPGGTILGGIFFLSIIFAALSSAINQLEVPVEAVLHNFNISRRKAAAMIGAGAFAVGVFLDLNMNLFGMFADFMSVILIPAGAVIILGIYFFCIDKQQIVSEIEKGGSLKIGEMTVSLGRYIMIPGSVAIIILGVLYGGIG